MKSIKRRGDKIYWSSNSAKVLGCKGFIEKIFKFLRGWGELRLGEMREELKNKITALKARGSPCAKTQDPALPPPHLRPQAPKAALSQVHQPNGPITSINAKSAHEQTDKYTPENKCNRG